MKTVFKSRAFCYAKDPENSQQNQDAFQVSEATGMAVVADGVSSAIFSGTWADILTRHVVRDNPDPTKWEEFLPWLTQLRTEWEQGIDTSNLTWFQRPKMAAGAFSTLVWVHVREIAPPREGSQFWVKLNQPIPGRRCFHVKGYCIGDSCLFHVRPGCNDSPTIAGTDLYHAIPLTDSEAFDVPPIVIGSKDLGRDGQMLFQPIDFLAQEGDLVVLATDAVSQWLLRCYEQQAYPRWDAFWTLSQESWGMELDNLREAGAIRYDDSTLVLLQLGSSDSFMNLIPDDLENCEPETVASLEADENITVTEYVENEVECELECEQECEQESVEEIKDTESVATDEDFLTETFTDMPSETVEENEEENEENGEVKEAPAGMPEYVPTVPVRGENRLGEKPLPNRGFQYRMASSASTPMATHSDKPEKSSGAKPAPIRARSGHAPEATQKNNMPRQKTTQMQSQPQLTEADENAAKLSENWQQLKESSAQIAGILGNQLSEGMSRLGSGLNVGMSRLGAGLNEGMSQAKPKFQGMTQRLTQFFSRKDNTENEEEKTDAPSDDAQKPVRVVDPNRRRYYNPPPRE